MHELITSPEAWIAFLALLAMEVVLSIDNHIFISVATRGLPPAQQETARRIGVLQALAMRLALLSVIVWVIGLEVPVIDLGITGAPGPHGQPAFETAFSWRDLLLLAGGAFLICKAVVDIRRKLSPRGGLVPAPRVRNLAVVIAQITVLDWVFSIDSIMTAIGLTDALPIMMGAVVSSTIIMALAAGPISRHIAANPEIMVLELAFLPLIGMVMMAEGLGHHVPKGYIHAAMALAAFVEALNLAAARRREISRPPPKAT